MMNYLEIKRAYEEAKNTAREEIADILISANGMPLTSKEIATLANSGIGVNNVAGFCSQNGQDMRTVLAREGKMEIYGSTRLTTKRYVNIDNPNDTINVTVKEQTWYV